MVHVCVRVQVKELEQLRVGPAVSLYPWTLLALGLRGFGLWGLSVHILCLMGCLAAFTRQTETRLE